MKKKRENNTLIIYLNSRTANIKCYHYFHLKNWFVRMTTVWIRHQLCSPCLSPLAQNRHVWFRASKTAFGLKMNAEIMSMDATGHFSRNAPSTELSKQKPGSTLKFPPAILLYHRGPAGGRLRETLSHLSLKSFTKWWLQTLKLVHRCLSLPVLCVCWHVTLVMSGFV